MSTEEIIEEINSIIDSSPDLAMEYIAEPKFPTTGTVRNINSLITISNDPESLKDSFMHLQSFHFWKLESLEQSLDVMSNYGKPNIDRKELIEITPNLNLDGDLYVCLMRIINRDN